MLADIDNRLDMCFALSTPIKSYALSSIDKGGPISIDVHMQGNEMLFNFLTDQISERERMLIETLNPVKIGEVTVVAEKIENPVLRSINENASSVPSLMSAELFVEKGYLHLSYRFHSSDKSNVNKLLRKIVSLDENIQSLKMGPSRGLIRVLEEIDGRMPLASVSFSHVASSKNDFKVEWKNLATDPYTGLRHSLEGKKIPKLYDMSKDPSSELLGTILKDHIPLAYYLEHHKTERVNCLAIVPAFLLKSFLIRLYNSSERMKNMVIERICTFQDIKGTPECV